MTTATRIAIALATLLFCGALAAQVPAPEKTYSPAPENPGQKPRLEMTATEQALTVSNGDFLRQCVVVIGLRERNVPGSRLRIEPLAILFRGDFDPNGQLRFAWPIADEIRPLDFKLQAIQPIDAKGYYVSNVLSLHFDGKGVRDGAR